MAGSRKLALLAALLLSAGCTTLPSLDPSPTVIEASADRFIKANHEGVDGLLGSLLRGKEFVKDEPIIVATLVHVDDLRGSRFGKLVSEQLATRLTQRGYPVVELKLRGNIFVRQSEGELLLSRELKDISLNHKAQAVLVGTYAEAKGFIYITIKLIESATGQAIAAHDYALPVDGTIYSLLPGQARY